MSSNFDISSARKILAKYSSSPATGIKNQNNNNNNNSADEEENDKNLQQHFSPRPPPPPPQPQSQSPSSWQSPSSTTARNYHQNNNNTTNTASVTAASASRRRKYLQAQLHHQHQNEIIVGSSSTSANEIHASLSQHQLLNETHRAFLREANSKKDITPSTDAGDDWTTISTILNIFVDDDTMRSSMSKIDLLAASRWPLCASSISSLALIDAAELLSAAFHHRTSRSDPISLRDLPWNLECEVLTPEKVYSSTSNNNSSPSAFSFATMTAIDLQNALMERVALSMTNNHVSDEPITNNTKNNQIDPNVIDELFLFKKGAAGKISVIVDAFVSTPSNTVTVVLASSSSSSSSSIHFENVDFDSVIKKSYIRQSACVMRVKRNHHRVNQYNPQQEHEDDSTNNNARAITRNPLARAIANRFASHFKALSSSSLNFDSSLIADFKTILSSDASFTVAEFATFLSEVVLSGAKNTTSNQGSATTTAVTSSLPSVVFTSPFVHQPQQKPFIFAFSSSSSSSSAKPMLSSSILEELFFSPKSMFLHEHYYNNNQDGQSSKFSPQIFILYDDNICFGETRVSSNSSNFYFNGLEDHDDDGDHHEATLVKQLQKRNRKWIRVAGFERRPNPTLLIHGDENAANPSRPSSWSIELTTTEKKEEDFVSACLKGMIIVTRRKEDTKCIQNINKKYGSASTPLFERVPVLGDDEEVNDNNNNHEEAENDDEKIIGTDDDFEENDHEDEASKIVKRRRKHARNKRLEELVGSVTSKTTSQQVTKMTVFNRNHDDPASSSSSPVPGLLKLSLVFKTLSRLFFTERSAFISLHDFVTSAVASSSSFHAWFRFMSVFGDTSSSCSSSSSSSGLESLAVMIENILAVDHNYQRHNNSNNHNSGSEKTRVRSGYFIRDNDKKRNSNNKHETAAADSSDKIKSNDERKKLNTIKLVDSSRNVTFSINSAEDLERILLLTCASSTSFKKPFRKGVIIHYTKKNNHQNNNNNNHLPDGAPFGNIAALVGVTKVVSNKTVVTEWKASTEQSNNNNDANTSSSNPYATSTTSPMMLKRSVTAVAEDFNRSANLNNTTQQHHHHHHHHNNSSSTKPPPPVPLPATTTSSSRSRYVFQFQDEASCSWSMSSHELFSSSSSVLIDGLILIETTIIPAATKGQQLQNKKPTSETEEGAIAEEEEEYDIATDRGIKSQLTLLRLAGEDSNDGNNNNNQNKLIIQDVPKRFKKIEMLADILHSSFSFCFAPTMSSLVYVNNLLATLAVAFGQLRVSVTPSLLFAHFPADRPRNDDGDGENLHIDELLAAATKFIEEEKAKLLSVHGARRRVLSNNNNNNKNKFDIINLFGRIKCSKVRAAQDFLPGTLQELFETKNNVVNDDDIKEETSLVEFVAHEKLSSSSRTNNNYNTNQSPSISKKLILGLDESRSSCSDDEEDYEDDDDEKNNRKYNIINLNAARKIGMFIFDVEYFRSTRFGESDHEKRNNWGCCLIEGFDAEHGIVHVCDVAATISSSSKCHHQAGFGRRWRMTLAEMMESGRRAFGGGDRKDLSFPILVLEKS